MKMLMGRDSGLSFRLFDNQRCRFGLTEILAPLIEGGADLLGLGGAAAETGVGAIGAGEAAGGAAATLGDIVGTGTGLAGGTTGLEGTLAAGGTGLGIGDAIGTGAATAAGSALDFLGAPGASGFNPGAVTAGGGAEFGSSTLASLGGTAPTAAGGTTAVGGGGSVFNTGTSPVTGVGPAGQPAAVGSGAVSAPTGVGAVPDATATAAGQVTGAAGPTSVGGAPVAGGSQTSLLDSLLGKAGSSLTNNPLGVGLGALGLGYNIYAGQQSTKNEKALTADAQQATANSNKLTASGEALQQYLTSGTLPPEYMTQVQQAISSAKATAISNAAAQGLPTDPTKNTALASTLAQIDASEPAMITQVATQLFSSGTGLISAGQNAANLSGQLYQALVQNDTQQAANIGKSIATLAASLSGKATNSIGGTTISIT